MRLLYLDTIPSLILCIFLWLFFKLAAVFISRRLPGRFFDGDNRLFRTYAWEDNGHIYERLFYVKRWKKRLPDGGAYGGEKGYRKRYLSSYKTTNLERFIEESARGELVHWLAIWPFIFFALFVEPYVVAIMLIYTLLVNLPCIIAQRYNRPRIKKIIKEKKLHGQ